MFDLISVIVPVFNVSEYLEQCIESIRSQTYGKLEIILVDDGSTDGSGQICDDYLALDSRIKVLHQDNGGSVSARKAGLRISTGKYIGFIDSDDYIEQNMYEKLYLKIEEYKVDFVESKIYSNDNKICNNEDDELIDFNNIDKAEFICQKVLENHILSFSLFTKLFRAELIKEAFFSLSDEQNYGEDLLCLYNYILKCNKLCLCKEAFYHYRIHQGSLSHTDLTKFCIEESKLQDCSIKFFRENALLEKCGPSKEKHYLQRILTAINTGRLNDIYIERYRFPSPQLLNNKNVVIYGAGRVGQDYYSQVSKYRNCKIVAWVDKNNASSSEMIPIEQPNILPTIKFDTLIIAVNNKKLADEIKRELLKNEFCDSYNSIIWEEPKCLW